MEITKNEIIDLIHYVRTIKKSTTITDEKLFESWLKANIKNQKSCSNCHYSKGDKCKNPIYKKLTATELIRIFMYLKQQA